ncbi:MAG: DcrB-related protein [candidate division Zixibacteria bacterium]|nr:DcrB-related protein [candidate division Zixibacteria bacterium]
MSTTNSRFVITLPDEWEDQTVHTYMGPDDSGVKHMLTVTVSPKPETDDVSEFARERIDMAMNALQGAAILKDEPVELADGRPAYECIIKWIPTDGNVIFRKMVFMIYDGKGYSFAGNFSKKTIKTIGTVVDQMIVSLRPADGAGA